MIGTLLLVEDNEVDQMIFQRVAKRSGLVSEFEIASGCDAALDILEGRDGQPVDVIVLDLNMPGRDGFDFIEEATRRFGSSFARHVVVMLTSSLVPRDETRIRACPLVRELWSKPFKPDHIASLDRMLT